MSFVLNIKFPVPPSGFNLHFIARASISVDFPVPFSPIKNVTGVFNSISLKSFKSSILNGYLFGFGISSLFSFMLFL